MSKRKRSTQVVEDFNGPIEEIKETKGKSEHQIKTVLPKNPEQVKLFELLQNPKIEVLFVKGKAGTGKSLCSLAMGLQLVVEGVFDKLALFKPLVGIGKSMGALPGDSKEKVKLLYDSFFDNVGMVFPPSLLDKYMSKNKIELNTLEFIRGRSIHNAFIIVEEIQNLTDFELFTILTRKSERTKMVLLYDPKQSDLTKPGSILPMIATLETSGIEGLGFCELIKSERCKFVEDVSKLFENYNFTR